MSLNYIIHSTQAILGIVHDIQQLRNLILKAKYTSTLFDFNDQPTWQGDEIAEGRYVIEGQSFATHIFFEKVWHHEN